MELPFEKEAMKGTSLPDNMSLADIKAYEALRLLYYSYRKGIVSREKAKREKEDIAGKWVLEKSEEEFANRNNKALEYRIGKASEEYVKNRTLENADNLYAAFYGLPNKWREDIQ